MSFGICGGKRSKEKGYDVIIIGGGIAGLYAAYTIKRYSPHASLQIVEKNKRILAGGRTGNQSFYGTEVAIGAGIGRKHDKLLRKLLKELGFEMEEFRVTPFFPKQFEPLDVNKTMIMLRQEYEKRQRNIKQPDPLTFEQFAKPILGEDYKRFLISSGYTDYEKEDIVDTLYNYGMEDNACCLRAFGVNWRRLVTALMSEIGEFSIQFSVNATAIKRGDDPVYRYTVETESGRKYFCKKVIVATTISSVRTLLPNPIYRGIEGQPFSRVYGKFTKQSIPVIKEYVKGYTCVVGPLQKIIPINPDEGIYMIAYNDNANTKKLRGYAENTEQNRDVYCRLLEKALSISFGRLQLIAIRTYYWEIGTHYYKPLNTELYKDRDEFIQEAQHPEDGILVVGEAVCKNPGWVEGALKSVDSVVTARWLSQLD